MEQQIRSNKFIDLDRTYLLRIPPHSWVGLSIKLLSLINSFMLVSVQHKLVLLLVQLLVVSRKQTSC